VANHFHICRFAECRHSQQIIRTDQPTIRYGKRHYMHADCYLRAGKPLSELSDAQLESLPYFLLKELGQLDYVKTRLAS
jgi:hypothetical protein